MTATDFQIEPALRRAFRAAVAASPPARQAWKRAMRARRMSIWKILYYILIVTIVGPLALIAVPLIIMMGIEAHTGADGLLAAVTLLSTVLSIGGAHFFIVRLRKSRPISVLAHLPAADADIPRHVWREPAAWSFCTLYLAALACGYLAWKNQFGLGGWCLAGAVAVAQWLTCLATGTLLAVLVPRFPFQLVYTVLAYTGIIYCEAGAPHFADVITAQYLLFPAGWVNALLGQAFMNQVTGAWWAAIPAIAWIASLAIAQRRLAQVYVIEELQIRPDDEPLPVLSSPFAARPNFFAGFWGYIFPWLAKVPEVDAAELSLGEAERRIRTSAFLQATTWPRPMWMERVVDHWLTDRERAILELLTANRPRWSRTWWMLAFAAAILGIMQAFGNFPGPGNLLMVGVAVAYASVFAVVAGPWPGFRTRDCAGAFIPYFAIQPVNFDEISHVMLKVGIVRSLCLVLLVGGIVVCDSGANNIDPPLAIFLVAGYAGLLLVLQGWVIGFYLSLGMRYPDLRWRTLPWNVLPVLLATASLLVGFPCLVVGFLQPAPGMEFLSLAGFALLVLCSWGAWRSVRAMYHRGLVDLVRNERSSEEQLFHLYDAAELRRRLAEDLRQKYGWLWWLRGRAD